MALIGVDMFKRASSQIDAVIEEESMFGFMTKPAFSKGQSLSIDVPQEESAPYEFGLETPSEPVNRIMGPIDSPAQGASKPYRPVPETSSGGVPTYALIAIAVAGAFVMFKGIK